MNRELLKLKMSEKNLNQGQLASKIGICENSLSRKILGRREFRVSEVIAICEILDIKNPADIFFV